MSMTDHEIIARQSAKIFELEDKLAEEKEVAKHWMDECQKRIPVTKIYSGDLSSIIKDVLEGKIK
jgi:hypothetical protein